MWHMMIVCNLEKLKRNLYRMIEFGKLKFEEMIWDHTLLPHGQKFLEKEDSDPEKLKK